MNSQTVLKIEGDRVWTILSAFVTSTLVSFPSSAIASPIDALTSNQRESTQLFVSFNPSERCYTHLDTFDNKGVSDDTPDHHLCEWHFSTPSAATAPSHGLIPTVELSSGGIVTPDPDLENLRREIPHLLSSSHPGAIAQTTIPASDRGHELSNDSMNDSSGDSRETPDDSIEDSIESDNSVEQLDLDPALVEDSPVFQRWLEEIPDIASDIDRDPSFRTRLRLGYVDVWSADDGEGFTVGIEDVFLGQTGLTLSADYQSTFDGEHESVGANLRYYILPLGHYVNIAPQVGYRNLDVEGFATDGLDLGIRVIAVPSRTGAADISVSQRWVNPGSDRHEVSLTTLTFGYAVTQRLRVSTEFEWQKNPDDTDRRLGIVLEWML
ncbi:MAG: hypothetical protein ACFE0J_00450 [Elainellaceae cyanobacterium]